MANVNSFHSVGDSLIRFLDNRYPHDDDNMPSCQFELTSSGELAGDIDDTTKLTLYVYRVTFNEHVRNSARPRLSGVPTVPLSLDLHFMLSVWSNSAAEEHTICAWAMQQLYTHPIMDISSLTTDGGWQADEYIQIIPAELSNEDLMRIWDALAPNYRLSVSYIARTVRIDPDEVAGIPPVVATRFDYSEKAEEEVSDV